MKLAVLITQPSKDDEIYSIAIRFMLNYDNCLNISSVALIDYLEPFSNLYLDHLSKCAI